LVEPYRVEILAAARRQLEKLARPPQGRVRQAVRALAADPRPPGAKLLSEQRTIWRIRVGDYRVLYEIRDEQLVVLVIRLGHRREVYRGRRTGG
jgi:mRNA interferase RelE/StbE